jgi:hypothetical protein
VNPHVSPIRSFHQLAKMAGDKAGVNGEGHQLVLVFTQLRDSGDMVELQPEERPLALVLGEVQVSRVEQYRGVERSLFVKMGKDVLALACSLAKAARFLPAAPDSGSRANGSSGPRERPSGACTSVLPRPPLLQQRRGASVAHFRPHLRAVRGRLPRAVLFFFMADFQASGFCLVPLITFSHARRTRRMTLP